MKCWRVEQWDKSKQQHEGKESRAEEGSVLAAGSDPHTAPTTCSPSGLFITGLSAASARLVIAHIFIESRMSDATRLSFIGFFPLGDRDPLMLTTLRG